jgi:hypothetical protein
MPYLLVYPIILLFIQDCRIVTCGYVPAPTKKLAANLTHLDGRARRMMYPMAATEKHTSNTTPLFLMRSETMPVTMMNIAVKAQIGIVRRFVLMGVKPKLVSRTGRKFPNAARLTFEVP